MVRPEPAGRPPHQHHHHHQQQQRRKNVAHVKTKKRKPPPLSTSSGAAAAAAGRRQEEAMISSSSCSLEDWVSALAAKEVASSSALTTKGGGATTTKEERVAKREAKKMKKQHNRMIREQQQGQELNTTNNRKRRRRSRDDDYQHHSGAGDVVVEDAATATAAAASANARMIPRKGDRRTQQSKRRSENVNDWRLLQSLALEMEKACCAVSTSRKRSFSADHRSGEGRASTSTTARMQHTKKLRWDDEHLQPRKRDYGGIGLARPTLWLPFDDPSFYPKLENEFKEHVPGFFGRGNTKAMKKQLNKNMLWKQLADQKKTKHAKGGGDFHRKKYNGKKLSDMSPDERVEAMIKLGMV